MNEAAEKRFKRQVLTILQAEHTDPEGGWMGPLEVLTKLGHGTPGEVNRAVDALVSAGLAERYANTTQFRSRGVTASTDRTETP